MRKLKDFLIITLIFLMFFVFAACGSSKKDDKDKDQDKNDTSLVDKSDDDKSNEDENKQQMNRIMIQMNELIILSEEREHKNKIEIEMEN